MSDIANGIYISRHRAKFMKWEYNQNAGIALIYLHKSLLMCSFVEYTFRNALAQPCA